MERGKRRTLGAISIFFLAFCSFLVPLYLFRSPSSAIIPLCSYLSAEPETILPARKEKPPKLPLPASKEETPKITDKTPPSFLSCDRSGHDSDICKLQGDVRVDPSSSSVLLFSDSATSALEKIRPYTRKWDTKLMENTHELQLSTLNVSRGADYRCQVNYPVPAVIFSVGGFTGNVYHAFNDALIPLYTTSQKYKGKVVFLVLDYQAWWLHKYRDIFSKLSDYPPIDFKGDNLIRCFPEVTVGLHVYGELHINPSLSPQNKTMVDFRNFLEAAFGPRIRSEMPNDENTPALKPKVAIIFREGTRAVENEKELVQLCEDVGFRVEIIRPTVVMDIAIIYKAINSSDAFIGVIGAGMTHFLFQKPGDVLIQIVLLGTKWAAETSYGVPAEKMGLKYVSYRIKTWESSLSRIYNRSDPVITDPDSINKKGWDAAAKVYLQQQAVTVDLKRFKKYLVPAYKYIVERKEQ